MLGSKVGYLLMIKKIFFIILTMAFVSCCVLTTAHAIDYDVYSSSISDTYQEYFKRVLLKQDLNNEYVCFRASNNEYYMFYSPNLELHNKEFICNSTIQGCKIDTVNVSGSSFNTYQSLEFFEIDNLKISCDDKIVYSSLGDYPIIFESGELYVQMQTTIMLVACCFFFIYLILRRCSRFR